MKYLLDTNVCIGYLNGKSEKIIRMLKSTAPKDVVICSVVKAELFLGAYKSNFPDKTYAKLINFLDMFRTLPFDDKSADMFGRIRSELEKAGIPIGPYDFQIASIALVHDLILVTHNAKEFSRIKGLKTEDWEKTVA